MSKNENYTAPFPAGSKTQKRRKILSAAFVMVCLILDQESCS